MRCWICFWLLCLVAGGAYADDDSAPVFRSDVAMGRIDTLVVDRSRHTIPNLRAEDFVLSEDGKPILIRKFAHEELPVDVLLLLDISGSMRVHVQRVASAAHQALAVLGPQDRVGIMVFTTHTSLRLPFRQDLNEVERKLDDVVRLEPFNGGTNINGALLDAAAYVEKEGRRQTRHAIVIVTDDQASPCDQPQVAAALDRADAVLMALLAPAVIGRGGRGGGGAPGRYPPVSTPWPGGGAPGGPLGGVILGRRRTPTGTPVPGAPPGTVGFPGSESAGSAEIARASGGDSLSVNDASAVETTFERIRQRYALYFYLPDGAQPSQRRNIEVDLSDSARRRHPDAELQYRQVYLAKDGVRPGLITRVPAHPPTGREPAASRDPAAAAQQANAAPPRRRPAVSESTGPRVGLTVKPPPEGAPTNSAEPESREDSPRRRTISEPDGTKPNSGRP